MTTGTAKKFIFILIASILLISVVSVYVSASGLFDVYPASYFFPLNTSVSSATGFDLLSDTRFGGGFSSGGATIYSNGDIWTNGSLFISGNISSVTITETAINGSWYPALDNTFDNGKPTYRWANIYGVNENLTGNLYVANLLANSWLYNQTTAANQTIYNAYNAIWLSTYNATYARWAYNQTAKCGDGITDDWEECDDGNSNNSDDCLDTCLNPTCGDGYVYTGFEECDDGNSYNTDYCNNDCEITYCGDCIVNPVLGEECDYCLNPDNCTEGCASARCGDGIMQGTEECDDANVDNTDDCLDTCLNPTCGDGYVHAGYETCDDGNPSDNDYCRNDCELGVCGDGYVSATEECDDGTGDDTDACVSSTCKYAYCGDGYMYSGVEGCDDGNLDNTDDCVNDCKLSVCGDGIVSTGSSPEQCDDGNSIDGDLCTNSCTVPSVILWNKTNGNATFISGNVGIKTTTPNYALTVNGDVNLNNTFYVNKASGFVGIKTTAPTHTLNVVGNVNVTGKVYDGGRAYGHAYDRNYTNTTLTNPNTWYLVNISSSVNLKNVSFGSNIFTVTQAGKYKVHYSLQVGDADEGHNIAAKLGKNGATEIEGSYIGTSAASGYWVELSNEVIVDLAAGDTVGLYAGSSATGAIVKAPIAGPVPTYYIGATLTIEKIDN